MKDLKTSKPTSFDERRKTFGTASGMAILEELQIIKDSIAAQKQHLDLLAPVQALKEWSDWVAAGSVLDNYPFTRKQSISRSLRSTDEGLWECIAFAISAILNDQLSFV